VRTWQANNERFFHFTVDASAKIIQRTWRGGICRRDFVQKVASITTIQSFFRSTKALDEYRRTRSAAVSVQACWRRYYAMLNYELDVLEIVIAQSLIRRRLSRIEAQRRRQSVQLLQNLARCWHSRRRLEHLRCQHHDYLERHESAISLQVSRPLII
jgi:myosin heavy subunit